MKEGIIKILYLEDNPGDARLVKEMISTSKDVLFQLKHYERLKSALEQLKQDSFDIILTDLNLPDSRGLETFQRIYSQTTTAIVILTGEYEEETVALEALKIGAQDYLRKDEINSRLLIRVILYAIERKKIEEELRLSKENLEIKVKERTAKLEDLNLKLQATTTELIQANHTKSDFLAAMSHELRNPLNSIIGFSEVLHDEIHGPLNAKQKDYSNDILQSGRNLLTLVNRILDFSKVEAGKMELSFSIFSLEDLLKDYLTVIAEESSNKNIKIETEIADNIGTIKADEQKIRQVLYNLLSNAAKFTPENGTIRIHAKKITDNIEIAIQDTGIGIDPKYKNKIFEDFFQIENIYTRKYAGAGLGLSLSKKIIELHKGELWFESEGLEKGTTFKFTLPVKQ